MRRFTIGMMVACFMAVMAFAPATILAGDAAHKEAGKGDIKTTSASESAKKDTMKMADKDKKGKKDAAAKKEAK